MNKKEITNLIILLTILISVCFGLAGVAVLLSTIQVNNDGLTVIYDTISAITSIISSVATVLALLLAFSGIDTWKKQLKYGKHLSIIWDSKHCLRDLQSSRIKWYIYLYAFGKNELNSNENLKLEAQILEKDLEQLKKSFTALDTIIVKNKWEWSNYAVELNTSFGEISKILKNNQKNPQDLEEKLLKQNNLIDSHFIYLETQLEELELQYS
ncbi:hypothetical protein [Colwellia sp. 20A7]|uniref:hypothetical protein n=1 Tax=Colwellia sp. 20A7 TaxID=2689569 RepID=UPI001359D40C|nr:hypothetical protein [Colwellia sp. 20A7]